MKTTTNISAAMMTIGITTVISITTRITMPIISLSLSLPLSLSLTLSLSLSLNMTHLVASKRLSMRLFL